jgi:hypothetical protein
VPRSLQGTPRAMPPSTRCCFGIFRNDRGTPLSPLRSHPATSCSSTPNKRLPRGTQPGTAVVPSAPGLLRARHSSQAIRCPRNAGHSRCECVQRAGPMLRARM